MSYTYEYPRPSLAVDIALFSPPTKKSIFGGAPNILLIQRKNQPYQGRWALPGGFLNDGERLEDAARRELQEETNLNVSQYMPKLVGIYDNPNRDSRTRVISVCYLFKLPQQFTPHAGDDAANAKWFPINEVHMLAFDHDMIIHDAWRKYNGK